MSTNYDRATIEHMLRIGRGGAIRYLLASDMSAYRDLILDNCLHNMAYDTQVEGNRADYLYPLLRKSNEVDYYRKEIIESLLTTENRSDADQLFDFAVLFARDGYTNARDAAYERFDRHDLEESWSYATSLVAIDGVDGLLYVLDSIGSSPANLESSDQDDFVIRCITMDYCDAVAIKQALLAARERNPNIARFLDHVAESQTPSLSLDEVISGRQKDLPQRNIRKEIQGLTWKEFRKYPKSDMLAVAWGKSATDEEIANSVDDIMSEKDPRRLVNYLRLFWKRPFPQDPGILSALFDNSSRRISHAVLNALSIIQHTEVRVLFERLLQIPEWSVMSINLLKSNYQGGDHLIIEKLLQQQTDPNELHSLGFALRDVYERNPVPEAERSLVFLYENGPCSNCREDCVEMLRARQQLPDWVLQECIYDANERLRSRAKEWLKETIQSQPRECLNDTNTNR